MRHALVHTALTVEPERNSSLTLIRVQPEQTARRGRGLVRFLSDLVQREDKPVPVVATCDHCGRHYNVSVDLSDAANPVVRSLPDSCRSCGDSLQRYEMIRDLIGTARYYIETATPVGAA
jgi:hypothetical protein